MTKIPITILLADDHHVVLEGLKSILSNYKHIKIIDTAINGKETLEKINTLNPEIVLLDINLPDISGIEITKIIAEKKLNTKVIFHTSHIDETYIMKGFEHGAYGYIPKEYDIDELIQAIETVSKGKRHIQGKVSDIFMENYFKKEEQKTIETSIPLSEREIEVLKLLATGYSNKTIAETLFISLRTVEGHKGRIMKKLDIHNMAELTLYAIKNKIIEIE